MEAEIWFEDLEAGMEMNLPEYLVTAEEIVEFAQQFDPAPFHLDEAAGKQSFLGGLAASGWHLCAISMAMVCDVFISKAASQGSPGIESCKWMRPVLAGDRLGGKLIVKSARPSVSRPHIGLVTFVCSLTNQRGETVMEYVNTGMVLRREAV